ncbi:hypothetical protein C1X74_31155, partial [Pseudomonas sp. GW460-5]
MTKPCKVPSTNSSIIANPCGSGHARECGSSGKGVFRPDAFAGTPAPTGFHICLSSRAYLMTQPT